MAHGKWFSVDRIAAAVAVSRSPQRVSLYGAPTVEIVAGTLEPDRAPQHRRGRAANERSGQDQDQEPGDEGHEHPELDLTPL
ncbi:MAG: hypothetical protein ACLQVK_01205 [Acidimicrobiales bacterium]